MSLSCVWASVDSGLGFGHCVVLDSWSESECEDMDVDVDEDGE